MDFFVVILFLNAIDFYSLYIYIYTDLNQYNIHKVMDDIAFCMLSH